MNNNNSTVNNQEQGFCPFTFPLPNMLVQTGTKVVLKNMGEESVHFQQINDPTQSKVIKLNGRHGTALQYFPNNGTWSVELEGVVEDDDKNKNNDRYIMIVPIMNLEINLADNSYVILFAVSPRHDNHADWLEMTKGGTVLLQAGMMHGKKTLILCDDPNNVETFDPTPIYVQIKYMGIPNVLINDLLNGYKKLSNSKTK